MWTPLSGHVSQLEHGTGWSGQGLNDCGPASALRYAREAGKLPLGDIAGQLSDAAQQMRGQPDTPDNGYVTFSMVQDWLDNLGIASTYTNDFAAVEASAWAILLVDAYQLAPAQYPQDWSWLGQNSGLGDHLIAALPYWQGAGDWYNDPLAYDLGEVDNRYDTTAVAAAFRGGLVLPSTHRGEDPDPPAPPPAPAPKPVRRMARIACGLKRNARHGGPNLDNIPAHGQLLDLGGRSAVWAHVQYRASVGWIPADAIVPVA